ncbi:MAG: hypothetical protein LBQ31_02030 [Bacteroidales bacterium]|jgi:predicted transposase YbfD/YdcC|nr:hypothetical protein [Bacteroidales bacterium]
MVLDVVFLEDMQRKRNKNAAQNFAGVRKIVPNLLKRKVCAQNDLKQDGITIFYYN